MLLICYMYIKIDTSLTVKKFPPPKKKKYKEKKLLLFKRISGLFQKNSEIIHCLNIA